MQTQCSRSPLETEQAGERLAKTLTAGDVVAFLGDLGVGKTVFTRGLARGLGWDGDVTSPTFALINEYRGGRLPLCHLDAYRLDGSDGLFEIGFYEYLDAGWVAAVEWSERVCDALTPRWIVAIRRIDDDTREITITEGATH